MHMLASPSMLRFVASGVSRPRPNHFKQGGAVANSTRSETYDIVKVSGGYR